MLKSIVVTLLSFLIAATSFAVTAQANGWTCGTVITKGGCPIPIYLPDKSQGK